MDQFRGHIAKEIYRGETFAVVVFRPSGKSGKDEEFVAAGNIPAALVGEDLELSGSWVTHPKYGSQFKVQHAVRPAAASPTSIEAYLTHHVQGVGAAKAARLRQHFGEELQDIMEYQPMRLTEVSGITETIATGIHEAWNRSCLMKNIEMFLGQIGVSLGWAHKIIQSLGANAVEKIKANPYRLTDVSGIAFKKADEIAFSLGWKKDAPERIEAVLVWLMHEAEAQGHNYLPYDVLINKACEECSTNGPLATQILDHLLDFGKLKKELIQTPSGVVTLVYIPRLYDAEKGSSELLRDLMKSSAGPRVDPFWIEAALPDYEERNQMVLTERQTKAVIMALTEKVSILTGGPGTGKTAVVRTIATLADMLAWRILMVAPTGRAARNMEKVAELPAQTVHRCLEYGKGAGKNKFARNRYNRLEVDLLVVDETSMVDQELFYRLLEAVPASCHLLLVGDENQLPSVGCGAVLKDLIKCGRIPCVTLDKIHRQAEQSSIITNAHRVLQGQMPSFPPKDPTGKHIPDCSLISVGDGPTDNLDKLQKELLTLCQKTLPALGYVAKEQVQVLSPMKARAGGVQELNTILQTALNPTGMKIVLSQKEFRIGDRVMVTKNQPELDVSNGDIGILKKVYPDEKVLIIDFQGQQVRYPYEMAIHLTPGYAVTCHKSQGGEYPVVILVLLKRHYVMLQRQLLYTGMTRAKKKLFFLASKAAIEMAVKNNTIQDRNSFLWYRLKKDLPCQ